MSVIGYVSDEHYLALADVGVEFTQNDKLVGHTKSFMSGAVETDLPAGDYRMTLGKPGFGSKHIDITLPVKEPIKFRLLSDKLVGYMWPKWTTSGEKSGIMINSAASCRVELFRYGLKKESHGVVTWLDEHGPRAMIQIIPDDDISQTGVQFGRVGFPRPLMTWKIIAPEKSGLYYVHLENEAGEFFSMPWIVAPKTPKAKIAVLAATNNWNAYNNYGGRSNYINSDGIPTRPVINARQDLARYQGKVPTWSGENDSYPPISFERPELANHIAKDELVTDPMGGRLDSTLAPGMWRLLGWLEREGYEYDVYSDAQLRDGTLDLDAYKVLMTEMHPEYWYREEYERVRDWVYERDGRFMYMGGNGIDCEVEYVDPDRGRYLTSMKGAALEFGSAAIPANYQFDNRFHKTFESPAPLIGVICDGEGTSAPYECRSADHWIFEGTGLKNGDTFGEKTLHERVPGGASGHETDNRTRNTGEGFVSLAKGLNSTENGSSGAEMVYKDFPGKGGQVFSTGSITYISALLVDDAISQITKNVIDNFLQEKVGS